MSVMLRTDIEYIVHCEKDGTIIGPISRSHAHLPGVRETLTHFSTWAMVYHVASGTYGLQLKNPKKHYADTGNKWDMGVGGHNCYVHEGDAWRPLLFEENLIEEASGEIGISITMVDEPAKLLSDEATGLIFDRFHYKTEIDNEWVGLGLITVPDQNVSFNDGEVIDFQWLTPEELASFLETETNFCAPLPLVFEKCQQFRSMNNI